MADVLFLQTAFNLSVSRAGQARPRQWKGHRMIQRRRPALSQQNKRGGVGDNGSEERRRLGDHIDHITKIEPLVVLFGPRPPSADAGLEWEALMRNADISARERAVSSWEGE